MNQSKLSEFHDDKVKAKEPALTSGLIVTNGVGILGLINVFFPHLLTDQQELSVYIIAAFVLPIITAVFTRGRVWSPASVDELLEEAITSAEEVKKNQGPKLI